MGLSEPSNSNTEKESSGLLKIPNKDFQTNKCKNLEIVMVLEQCSFKDQTYSFYSVDKFSDRFICSSSSVWHFGIMRNTLIMQVLF